MEYIIVITVRHISTSCVQDRFGFDVLCQELTRVGRIEIYGDSPDCQLNFHHENSP